MNGVNSGIPLYLEQFLEIYLYNYRHIYCPWCERAFRVNDDRILNYPLKSSYYYSKLIISTS